MRYTERLMSKACQIQSFAAKLLYHMHGAHTHRHAPQIVYAIRLNDTSLQVVGLEPLLEKVGKF